ncbi:NAD(P)-binding protein [Schizopora paradoxa]|uniref:NAD(P)-binding protein n=1 Tax=Schizopora paradoxa TaxID=27342 RepID=A0A0H2RKC0_9AGAM|nr:NAD(P)-binding protein [Schizopora paradoxa]
MDHGVPFETILDRLPLSPPTQLQTHILSTMKVLVFGGSKNIGYYSAERLLDSGATVYFQLRRPSAFDEDEKIQKYVKSGKAFIIQGDALKAEDVQRAFTEASADGPIDFVLFTVGGAPTFKLSKGMVLDPPDICSASMLNVLAAMPRDPVPKLILISSIGLTKTSHESLPALLKPMYGYLLQHPHEDKLAMERVIAYAAGREWKEEEPSASILPEGWQSRLPEAGFQKRTLVVRPAFLTDGKCKADKEGNAGYRASDQELGGYTVSRRDVAHFIAEQAVKDWEKYENSIINVGY